MRADEDEDGADADVRGADAAVVNIDADCPKFPFSPKSLLSITDPATSLTSRRTDVAYSFALSKKSWDIRVSSGRVLLEKRLPKLVRKGMAKVTGLHALLKTTVLF